jgi:hypothetical protein
MQKLRIVTIGISGGRSPADFPRHDGSAYWGLRVRRWGLGFVHRSRTILCRAVPNLSVTFANFLIAVGVRVVGRKARQAGDARSLRSEDATPAKGRKGPKPKKVFNLNTNKPFWGGWAKPQPSARFPPKSIGTRKAPLYENCRILAPDGKSPNSSFLRWAAVA